MRSFVVSLVLLVVSAVQPAQAHKVVAATYVTGAAIEGEIGFSDGTMAADTVVTVTTPDGRSLGETRTDSDGFFTFTPTEAVDHVFRADLGAGHTAEVTVVAADLPRVIGQAERAGDTAVTASPAAAAQPAVPQALSPMLREAIAVAVRDEVRPLRRALVELREKNDLQSVLGGIGYIVGVFGIAFYLVGRQRLKKA